MHERLTYFIENAPPFPLESWILPFSILHNKEKTELNERECCFELNEL